MSVTSLNVPTLEEVKGMNEQTAGEGCIFARDKVSGIFGMEHSIFSQNHVELNFEDPLVLGLSWAYLIANEHIFADGNKTTATLVLKYIVENNGRHFNPGVNLMNIVNSMVPGNEDGGESGESKTAAVVVKETVDKYKDICS